MAKSEWISTVHVMEQQSKRKPRFRWELANCTSTLLREIATPEITQPSLALTYGLAIRSSEPTDWAVVNQAIVSRWSRSGLERVKTLAWKKIEGRGEGGRRGK